MNHVCYIGEIILLIINPTRHQQRLVLEQLDLLRREITPSGMYLLEAQDEDTRMERLKMVVT
jgi:hypothetical protein